MKKDNIWFTRKARIRASERLLSNDFHSQCLLVYYSALLAIVSILDLKYNLMFNGKSSEILCALSVLVLVGSLFISSVNFKGRGLAFKDNYIALQALYERIDIRHSPVLHKQDIDDYLELLKNCENHSPLDDLYARVIAGSGLTSRIPSKLDVAWLCFNLFFRFIFLSVLYVLPIALLYMFW